MCDTDCTQNIQIKVLCSVYHVSYNGSVALQSLQGKERGGTCSGIGVIEMW